MKKILSILCAFLALSAVPAIASPMIEVGAGVGFSDGKRPMEAVFRVDINSGGTVENGYYFVIARIGADAMIGQNGVSYIDMHFDAFNATMGTGDLFVGLTAVSTDVQRNVQIGNDMTARISLVGIRGGVGASLSDDASIYLRGAADLIGIGMTRTTSGREARGAGAGLAGEIGLRFNNIRIALGETASFAARYNGGDHCWGDDDGYYACSSRYDDDHFKGIASSSYLSLVIDLTENLKFFSKLSHNVYIYGGDGDNVTQFFLGVSKTL